MSQQPTSDPIVEVIHQTRREISKKFAGDIDRIAADAAERLAASGRPIWQPKEVATGADEAKAG